jgi:hypothetical protein
MTNLPQKRSCDWYHRQLHELQSPFENPKFETAEFDWLTAQLVTENGELHLKVTIVDTTGEHSVLLRTNQGDDLQRRIFSLVQITRDPEGLDGHMASYYRTPHSRSCDC